jgi:putative phage-type endonuclease
VGGNEREGREVRREGAGDNVSYRIIDAEQRSAEWFDARLGRLTASDAPKMMATVQKGEAAARRDLRIRLVCERLTGRSAEEPFTNADMERGIALEPQARIAYEFHSGANVKPIGFLQHAEHLAGASPDGIIGTPEAIDGLVEIKCPRSARHLTYLRDGKVPTEHLPQLLHQLWVSGAPYVDFVSFDAAMPERLQLFVVRLEADPAKLADYEKKALAFLAEVETEYRAVKFIAEPSAVMAEVVA